MRSILDANVLYSAALRDIFIILAIFNVHEPHWTAQIHDEWIRNLARNRSELERAGLEKTRQLMDENRPNALVSSYEHRIETLTLPDKGDRHILAAAIESRASVIVTFNLKDFPHGKLKKWDIIAQSPDDFLADLWPQHSDNILAALANYRARLKNPALEAPQFLANLRLRRLTKFVALIEPFASQL